MADKGWTARIATAAGAAAGTGAAQLGLGYGLGVVVWPATPAPDDSAWLGSLGWATWITASATVFGAVLGSRYRGGPGPRTTAAWRFALAACAAVGALVAVALIALPARSAVRLDTFTPQVVAGGYAAVGLLLGLVVAFWAVSSRPVATNLMATGVWLWALAIAAIVVELAVNRDSATYLTSWQFAEVASSGRFGTIYWPSALLTLAAAFLVGALAATPAARRGDRGAGAATSGAAGPLLVAIAFLALAPRLTGALGPIESAYLIAPYAVLAGLAGSALAVAIARAVADRRSRRAAIAPARSAGPDDAAIGDATPHHTTSGDTAATAPVRLPDAPAATTGAGATTSGAGATAAGPAGAGATTAGTAAAGVTAAGVTAAGVTAAGVTAAGVTAAGNTAAGNTAAGAASADRPAKPRSSLFGRPRAARTGADQDIPHQSNPSRKDSAISEGAPRNSGKPKGVAARPVTDAEIASAARPRPRPRATAAPEAKPAKSTVTPPPAAPTVARINPEPSAKD
ncbi:Hansenula MRAKII killer toxin-resistant protein 1 [Actinoplanes sp. M2I2]|uniref:Hansenula MRAKII killer toxin-resistant protein 1 n=1 Tax=Actinoplanes sp. M2I2 TaxID=1734444 RepID=UPI0020203F64|nr:Hansenula MRAKII killer toxin-resistant protein 1 [Actinoplanes sp. M2I2]